MRDFLSEYRTGAADLLACYPKRPESLWTSSAGSEPWPDGLAEAIRGYNAERGHRPEISGAGPVIVTGQQPGLLTGPLYSIYKAITTLKLARLHAERTGVSATPIFWVGADDHDFDEAASVCYLSRRHTVETLSYAPANRIAGQCMFRVPIEPALHQMSETLAADVPGSEDAPAILQMLHDTLNESNSYADWSARLMARLFRGTPLVLFTPELSVARRIAAEVFRRELDDPLETTRRVNEAGQRLVKLGFEPQVVKSAEECSFFLDINGRRCKVIFENGVFFLPEADAKFSATDLRAMLESAPERFTANVALRCIIQQRLFPTRAYVAGPGELAYWAQLATAFDRHGLPMPVVWPRAQCLLTSIKLNKLRTKLGLSLDELSLSVEDSVTLAMQRAGAHPMLGRVQQSHQKSRAELDALGKALDPSAPAAAQMLPAMLAELDRGFTRLERALLMADESKHATVRQQVERLRHSLRPHRKPQERVLTVFSFLFEHGPGLISRLLSNIDPEAKTVQEIEL